jgi:hypothetical protein
MLAVRENITQESKGKINTMVARFIGEINWITE